VIGTNVSLNSATSRSVVTTKLFSGDLISYTCKSIPKEWVI